MLRDGVEYYDEEESSFTGFISRGAIGTDDDRCVISMLRDTPDSEKTTNDGSVIRIEDGRELSGVYFNNAGNQQFFEVKIEDDASSLLSSLWLPLCLGVL